jgi:hypothetical protein
MSHYSRRPISTRVRTLVGPVVLAGALGAGAVAAPAALASPAQSVRSHVHAADVALHAVATATINTDLSVPLETLINQIGAASKLGVNLSVGATTAGAEQLAGTTLALVVKEETKAEEILNAATATVTGVEQGAVATADETIAAAREAGLAALAQLTATAKATTHQVEKLLTNELNTLTAAGKGLLVSLSDAVQQVSGSVVAAVPTVVSHLAATVTGDVNADLGRDTGVVSEVGGMIPSTVTALQGLTAQILGGVEAGVTTGGPTTSTPTTGTPSTGAPSGGLLNIGANVSINTVLSGLLGL